MDRRKGFDLYHTEIVIIRKEVCPTYKFENIDQVTFKCVLHVVYLVPFLSEIIPINDGFSLIDFFLKIVSLFHGLQQIISDPCLNLACSSSCGVSNWNPFSAWGIAMGNTGQHLDLYLTETESSFPLYTSLQTIA